MFQGTSNLTIDAKGRVPMPSRHRDALMVQCEGRLTLMRHPDGCLLVYPRPVWEVKRDQVAQLPAHARDLRRRLLGSAVDIDLDSAGRFLVSAELREDAALVRDVKLMGLGSHFELWDAERLKAREDSAMATLMASAPADFTF